MIWVLNGWPREGSGGRRSAAADQRCREPALIPLDKASKKEKYCFCFFFALTGTTRLHFSVERSISLYTTLTARAFRLLDMPPDAAGADS